MTSNLLFESSEKLYNDLIQELAKINQQQKDNIQLAEQSLFFIDIVVRKLKIQVINYNFTCLAEEIYFFKNIKPKFISEYLFYTQLLELEISKPHSSKKNLKDYYRTRIQKLKVFYDDNREFYNYYIRRANYLDHKYFVRHSFDLKMNLPQQLYNFDEKFTTSHDDFISRFMANARLIQHISSELQNHEVSEIKKSNSVKNLHWTNSKTALVELLYALYQNQSFNAGAIELNEIIRTFENLFEIDLSNFHKTLTEIKARKTNPTKFLDQLSNNLNQFFQNDNL